MTDTHKALVNWNDAIQMPSLQSSMDTVRGLIDTDSHWQNIVKAVDATRIFNVDATRIFNNVPARDESLQATLFRNRAELKILTSQVAMHLRSEERSALFAAIDWLLDHAEWEDESTQIDEVAFRSYLRFMIFARPHRLPNFGVGPNGTLLTGWHIGENSVHAEFFPDDQCMVLIKFNSTRGPEKVAWRGNVARLRSVVENNGVADCID